MGTLDLDGDGVAVVVVATERAYWLAWSQIKHVGPVTIKRLWEHFGSLGAAWVASAGDLLAVDGVGLLIAERVVGQRSQINPDDLLKKHEQENQSFWTPADADYPALLFAINDPPPVLYYRGQLRLNDPKFALSVGIVGTRRPSNYGKKWTQRLSRQLTMQAGLIVSGLAAGIDTAAHQSCLEQDGFTVAVMGTGVDQIYPRQNKALYERIMATGLIVSEYPDGTGPDKTHFPQRNRIIAGLSRAVLVTEAPARSGALITARLANEYCREVYALPCSLDNVQGEGCLRLINQGAQVILGSQMLVDALAELPALDHEIVPSIDAKTARTDGDFVEAAVDEEAVEQMAMPELSPMLSQILNAVPLEPTLLDNIVQSVQAETGPVLAALMQLELSGLVIQLPGAQYQRA